MYTIYVKFDCVPGMREAFVEKMKSEGILDAIRNEEGCIKYDYYFSEKDPCELLLIEEWETKEHQQIHITQPHMSTMKKFKDTYITDTKLGEIELVRQKRCSMTYTYNREEINGEIFDFIYASAIRDAVSQKAYKGKKAWIEQLSEPKKITREYIDKVLNNGFSSRSEHDDIFLKTANSLCSVINSQRPAELDTDVFSFGNAQKLINITVKHVYGFCYRDPNLRVCFKYCHCPLDSIMIQRVKYLSKENNNLQAKDYDGPWGNEGADGDSQPTLSELPHRYALFQSAIRKLLEDGSLYPIEFDYIEWNKPKVQ